MGNGRNVFFVWLAGVVVLFLGFLVLPHDAFYSGDSGVKLLQVENLIANGYEDISLVYNGADIDPNDEFSPFLLRPNMFIKDGKNYSVFPVAFPYLSSFFYAMLGYAGLYVIPLLSAAILMAVVYGLASRFLPRGLAICAMLSTGFATPILFYSLCFWEHVPAVAIAYGSIYLFLKYNKNVLTALGAGLILGLAIWFRSDMAVWFAIMFVSGAVLLKEKGTLGVYLAGTTVSAGGLFWFNKIIYGEWFGHLTRNMDNKLTIPIRLRNLRVSLFALNKPQMIGGDSARWEMSFRLLRENRWLEAAFILLVVLMVGCGIWQWNANRKQKEIAWLNIVPAATGWGMLIVAIAYCVTFYFDKTPLTGTLLSGGVFTFSPFLAFALLFPCCKGKAVSSELKWLFWSSICFILIMPLPAPNDGGIRYGARYLLMAMPGLAMAAFAVVYEMVKAGKMRGVKIVFVALILVSFVIEVRGYQLLYYKKTVNQTFTQALLKSDAKRFVMTDWWPIFNSAPIMVKKKVHIAPNSRPLIKAIRRAKSLGEKRLDLIKVGKVGDNFFPQDFYNKLGVKLRGTKHLIFPYDTYFNYTIFELEL